MSNRKSYDEDLVQLGVALTEMGNAAAQAVESACTLLKKQNAGIARAIIDGDKQIDEREREIERQCLELLLRQQPVATDLRFVSTALKIVTDIERMGDHAADIAEISEMLEPKWCEHIPIQETLAEMENKTLEMVYQSISAFVEVDGKKALTVINQDDEVDALFDAIKKDLAGYIASNPDEIDAALDLLMVIKYLERLGDHAVNVAEWVRFLESGFYRGGQIV